MSKTLIFYWDFSITTDDQFLNVYLNDGLSVSIVLSDERAFKNISNILANILIIDHKNGTKTVVNNSEVLYEALDIANRKREEALEL